MCHSPNPIEQSSTTIVEISKVLCMLACRLSGCVTEESPLYAGLLSVRMCDRGCALQVDHMREVNHAQGQQLASTRADMESQAVAAAAQQQQVGFRLMYLTLCPACASSIPSRASMACGDLTV